MQDFDANEVVLINDNIVVEKAGDVSIYRNRRAAQDAREPLDANDVHVHLLTASGRRLELAAVGQKVEIRDSTDTRDYSHIVEAWLRHLVSARASPTEQASLSVREMLRLIKFDS